MSFISSWSTSRKNTECKILKRTWFDVITVQWLKQVSHFLRANRSISLHKIWSNLLHYPAKGPKMNVVYLWGCRLLITAIAVLVTADQLSGSSLPITLWASTSLSHGTAAPEQLTGGGTASQSRVLRWTQLTHWQEQALYCSWFTFLKCWEQLHESQIFYFFYFFFLTVAMRMFFPSEKPSDLQANSWFY